MQRVTRQRLWSDNTDSNDIVYKLDYGVVEDIFPNVDYYVYANESYNIITYDELETVYYHGYVRLTPKNYDPDNMYVRVEENVFEHITGKPNYASEMYFTGIYATSCDSFEYTDNTDLYTFYKVSSINT